MSTGRIVAASHCLVFISIKLPALLLEPSPAFWLRAAIAVSLQLLALLALSIAAAGTKTSTTQASITEYEQRKGAREIVPDVQQVGFIAGVYTLILPLLSPAYHPIAEAGLRCACFFYACKLIDLVVLKAEKPPLLIQNKTKPSSTSFSKAEYIFRLLTETRYASFDIAIQEPRRRNFQETTTLTHTILWTWLSRLLIPTATYFYPILELQLLLSLLLINFGLEGVHTLLHPFCPNELFFQPFAASGIIDFWSVHWHQGAQSWLISLGYRPAKRLAVEVFGLSKEVGTAVGVLGTFALSGIWHAWCVASLSDRKWETGVGLFLVFVAQGVGCLLERVVWAKGGGGWVRRVVCWTFAVEAGAMFFRYAKPYVREDVRWMIHPIESLGWARG
ncbi:Putative Wax synthase domain-containing protein [Septoria linicola]|uniref:Wax synthase domain-containing protein n=1 Tax=Septoria linicola TaxID=215465 RepID=A0A9Q9EQY0_9PEZI|nr:putative Wax synthase domain-containing protein [Septoria linicola]USW59294.1 Putative Wax synthase domain-containing protein [Septoria linicola]